MPLEFDRDVEQQNHGTALALLTCLDAHGIAVDDARLARLVEGWRHLQKMLAAWLPPTISDIDTPVAASAPAKTAAITPSVAASAPCVAASTVAAPVVHAVLHADTARGAAPSASHRQDAGGTVLPALLSSMSLSLFDASEQIRSGQLSPVALLEDCLQRIATLDDTIHAFTTLNIACAKRDAQRAADEIARGLWRGPLHGVPISIKDVIDVAGLPTLAQSRHRLDAPVPESHAEAVSRLVCAGAVVIGKTTTHEYAFGGPECASQALHVPERAIPGAQRLGTVVDTAVGRAAVGRAAVGSAGSASSALPTASGPAFQCAPVPGPAARNPWAVDRFAGGSSSGAAAGVACGMALGALGSDTAGSIRSPAALCGMTGFKPSRDTIALSGCLPLSNSLDAMGVIAGSALDCALLFDALTGADTSKSVPATLSGKLHGVKIGVIRHFFTDGVPISPVAAQHIDAAVHVFGDAGAIVREIQCAPLEIWHAVGMTILLAEAFALHAPMLRDRLGDCGHTFADAVLLGATISKETYQAALEQRIALTASLDACMQDDDLLIAPIQAGEAPFLSDVSLWGFLQRPSYGVPFNLSNMPALSLCCGFGPNGLPLALQLIAARGNDVQVLDAAYGFQMRTDWHIRHR